MKTEGIERVGDFGVRASESSRGLRPLSFWMAGEAGGSDADDGLHLVQEPGAAGARLALWAAGHQWLRSWDTAGDAASIRWNCWRSEPEYDFAEWSFKSDGGRVTRTCFRLRGRRLALVAEQVQGVAGPVVLGLRRHEDVTVKSAKEQRGLRLGLAKRGTLGVSIWPLALPALAYDSPRGSFESTGDRLLLRQAATGAVTWMPLLVSWHPERDRQAIHWRMLTVSEGRKICAPGVAFAARVGWADESHDLVIYRSLAAPATRCFLGYQTAARMMIGLFTPAGDVTPIFTLEDE